MTIQQSKPLNFIKAYIEKNGYSPTLEEMKNALGVTALSTVQDHLKNLIKGGYLARDGYK